MEVIGAAFGFLIAVLVTVCCGALLVLPFYLFVRALVRADAASDLRDALTAKNLDFVRAHLITHRHRLSSRQIRDAEVFVAQAELAEEDLADQRRTRPRALA